MQGIRIQIVGFSSLCLAAILCSQVQAAGYKLEFQSASVLADAGEAAVVEDAGTNWYNSAGLIKLPQQLVASAFDVYAPNTFGGTMSAPSAGSSFFAGGSASSHPNSFLPAFHYSFPFKEKFALGLSVVPAWGFMENYGENSMVRYDLTKIYTRTINIAPSFAMKINDQWSFGIGPDFHYFAVQSRNHVRTQPTTANDSISRFSADSWGYGGHAGILFQINEATRIGLNYRSKIMMNLDGYSDFGLDGIGSFESNSFKLPIPLPPTTTLSAYHDVNARWALMGTIAYDQWSVLDNYHGRNYIQPTGIIPSVVVQQNLSNTFDFSVGTHYKLNDQWMLRGSVKYVATPTNSSFRDINFPDGQKLGLNIGTRYQYNKKLAFDVMYGHVFVRTVHINGLNPVTGSLASGHSRTSIDLVGAQVVWNI
jgi:long-chain fatty acid transport protein